jgi:hypothetical protein
VEWFACMTIWLLPQYDFRAVVACAIGVVGCMYIYIHAWANKVYMGIHYETFGTSHSRSEAAVVLCCLRV